MTRRRTRRGGNKDKGVTRIKEEGGKWYIYVDDHKVQPGLDSFEKAKKAVEATKPSLAAYTLTQMKMKGGVMTIKQEANKKWYVYEDGQKVGHGYPTFEEAEKDMKQAMEASQAVYTLMKMKKKAGRRRTRRRS